MKDDAHDQLISDIRQATIEHDARPRPRTSSPPRDEVAKVTHSATPSPPPLREGDGDEVVTPSPTSSPAHSWQPRSLIGIAANPPAPPELVGLFYPGYNHLISGESESLKSWLMCVAAVADMSVGHGVFWTDGDDMGAGAILERLRLFGATDDQVDRLFGYVRPDEALGEKTRPAVLEFIRDTSCRLAIFDGFNPLLLLHGLNPNDGADVERFYQLIDPFKALGVANVVTDNVVKSKEGRQGGWAVGSERKRSKPEVHLGMRKLEALVRGGSGRSAIDVHKDRPGHLKRPVLGVLVVETGDPYSWRIQPDDSRGEQGEFRPSHLMLKVSRFIAGHPEPLSRNQIEEARLGKATYVRAATDLLIEEGYATEFKGARGARLVRHERPFVDDEDGGGS